MSTIQDVESVDGITLVTTELPIFAGEVGLVEIPEDAPIKGSEESTRFFIISGAHDSFAGWQCIAMAANAEGDILNFRTQAGGNGVSFTEVATEVVALAGGDT